MRGFVVFFFFPRSLSLCVWSLIDKSAQARPQKPQADRFIESHCPTCRGREAQAPGAGPGCTELEPHQRAAIADHCTTHNLEHKLPSTYSTDTTHSTTYTAGRQTSGGTVQVPTLTSLSDSSARAVPHHYTTSLSFFIFFLFSLLLPARHCLDLSPDSVPIAARSTASRSTQTDTRPVPRRTQELRRSRAHS